MKKIIFIVFILFSIGCGEKNPVKPENQNTVILSVSVFPDVVEPNDSLVVICNATDPDGDTLVYDWYLPSTALFNRYDNFQILYAPDSQYVSAPQDTFRIGCTVRDLKGGQVPGSVNFIVRQSIEGD